MPFYLRQHRKRSGDSFSQSVLMPYALIYPKKFHIEDEG